MLMMMIMIMIAPLITETYKTDVHSEILKVH